VRNRLLFAAAVVCVSMSAVGIAQRATPVGTGSPAASEPSVEDVLKAVRADLQLGRADIVAKNVTLTSEQAAKFWPVFDQYQKEQNAIMDEQMRGIQRYVNTYPNLDDAAALSLMQAHFDRDTRMNALRQKYLVEFQKVLPTRMAARVMQIDRRLSLVHQIEFAAQIPLIH